MKTPLAVLALCATALLAACGPTETTTTTERVTTQQPAPMQPPTTTTTITRTQRPGP